MSVAFDAVGPSSAGTSTVTTGATSLSWTHTAGGSANAVLVGVAVGTNGVNDTMTAAVTFGGTAMTSLGKVHANSQTFGYIELFGLLNPAIGAQTVAVTLSTGVNVLSIVGGSVSVTGAASFKAAVTAVGASTTPSVAVTGTASGNLVVDAVAAGSAVTSATSPSTNRWLNNASTSSGAGNAAQSSSPGTGGSVTMAYTVTSDWWGIVAVEVVAAGGGAAPGLVPPLVSQYGGFH